MQHKDFGGAFKAGAPMSPTDFGKKELILAPVYLSTTKSGLSNYHVCCLRNVHESLTLFFNLVKITLSNRIDFHIDRCHNNCNNDRSHQRRSRPQGFGVFRLATDYLRERDARYSRVGPTRSGWFLSSHSDSTTCDS